MQPRAAASICLKIPGKCRFLSHCICFVWAASGTKAVVELDNQLNALQPQSNAHACLCLTLKTEVKSYCLLQSTFWIFKHISLHLVGVVIDIFRSADWLYNLHDRSSLIVGSNWYGSKEQVWEGTRPACILAGSVPTLLERAFISPAGWNTILEVEGQKRRCLRMVESASRLPAAQFSL